MSESEMQSGQQNSPIAGSGAVSQVREVTFATPNEIFYFELGQQLAKNRLPFLGDLLRQLLTLGVGLAGGGVYFLNDAMCGQSFKAAAIAAFFAAAVLALIGILPVRGVLDPGNHRAVKTFVETAVRQRDRLIIAASACLLLGLAVAFAGVVAKASAENAAGAAGIAIPDAGADGWKQKQKKG